MARRIRRVGLDTVVNYTLQQTSAYDVNNPAGTPSSWGTAAEVTLMDQTLSQTAELNREGALITFARFPDFFSGLIVRLRPSYAPVDEPFLELWTYNGTVWTRHRRFELNNLLTGVRSGERKNFDLLLTTDLTGVQKVWITMTPTGAAINRFIAIHVYGECTPDVNQPDPCDIDPDACIEPDPCLVDPEPCLDDPINPDPPQDAPTPLPPPFPPIDLCDEEAVAAFEATLSPAQLTYWNDLVETIELDCDDETDHPPENDPGGDINPPGPMPPYLPKQPTETHFDPVDVEPSCDPDQQDVDCTPGSGFTPDQPAAARHRFFFFYNQADKTNFEGNLAAQPAEIQLAYADTPPANKIVWGTEVSFGARQTARLDRIEFTITGAANGSAVGIHSLSGLPKRIPADPSIVFNGAITRINALGYFSDFTPRWATDTTNGTFGTESGVVSPDPDGATYKPFFRDTFTTNILAIKPDPTDNVGPNSTGALQNFSFVGQGCVVGSNTYFYQACFRAFYVVIKAEGVDSILCTANVVTTPGFNIMTPFLAAPPAACTPFFDCLELTNYTAVCPN